MPSCIEGREGYGLDIAASPGCQRRNAPRKKNWFQEMGLQTKIKNRGRFVNRSARLSDRGGEKLSSSRCWQFNTILRATVNHARRTITIVSLRQSHNHNAPLDADRLEGAAKGSNHLSPPTETVRCTLYVVEASVQFLDVAKQGDKKIDRIVNRVQF